MKKIVEKPIFAYAEYHITLGGLIQDLRYYYHDPEHIYGNALEKGSLNEMLSRIRENLQSLLDEDYFAIDNNEKKWSVDKVELRFWSGHEDYPILLFKLSMPHEIPPGKHKIEFATEVQRINYDIAGVWFLPPFSRVLSVKTMMKVAIMPSAVYIWARKGMTVGGKEHIEFIFEGRV